jgi:hypothetical protein
VVGGKKQVPNLVRARWGARRLDDANLDGDHPGVGGAHLGGLLGDGGVVGVLVVGAQALLVAVVRHAGRRRPRRGLAQRRARCRRSPAPQRAARA